MLKVLFVLLSLATTSNIFALTTFHCESKTFNLGDVKVSLDGIITSNDQISSTSLSLDGAYAFSSQNLNSDTSFYNKTLNRFIVPSAAKNRWVIDSFLAILIPRQLLEGPHYFTGFLTTQNSKTPRTSEIYCIISE